MTTLHDSAAGERKRRTRRMAVVAVLLALAALAVWSAGRMGWIGYTSEDGLQPAQHATIDGDTWASELTPLAVVLLAGIAAMFAVRGWAQRIVGLVVVAAGAGVLVRSVTVLTAAVDPAKIARIEQLRAAVAITATEPHSGGAVLAAVGGLAAVAAGLILVARPRPRQNTASKYVTPAARRESVRKVLADRAQAGAGGGVTGGAAAPEDSDMTQRLFWEALDAGADPTDPDSVPEPEEVADAPRHPGAGDRPADG